MRPDATEPARRSPAIVFGLVLLLVVAVYAGAWNTGFYRDDYQWLDAARNITGRPVQILAADPANADAVTRVTQRLSMAVIFALAGPSAPAHHATSLILHAAVSTSLLLLLVRLARQAGIDSMLPAAAALVFFVTARAHAMAVLWVSAQATLWLGGAVVVMFLCALAERESDRARVVPVSLAYGVALLSKATGLFMPLVLAEALRAQRAPRVVARWLAPAAALAVGYLVWRTAIHGSVAAATHVPLDLEACLTASENMLTSLLACFAGARLYALTPLRAVPAWIPGGLLLLLAIVASRRSRHRVLWRVGLAWVLAASVVPALVGRVLYNAADLTVTRYAYLPAMGASMLVMAGTASLRRHVSSRVFLVTVLSVGLVYVVGNAVLIHADVEILGRVGARSAAIIAQTQREALALESGTTIVPEGWGIEDELIASIDRLYFEDRGHTLATIPPADGARWVIARIQEGRVVLVRPR